MNCIKSFLFLLLFTCLQSICFSNISHETEFRKSIDKSDSLFLQFNFTGATSTLNGLFSSPKLSKSEEALLNYRMGLCFFEIQQFDSALLYFNTALSLLDNNAIDLKINIIIKQNSIPKNALNLAECFKRLVDITGTSDFEKAHPLTKANVYYYWLSTSWVLKDINETKKYYHLLSAILDSIPMQSLNDKLDKAQLFEHYTKLSTYIIINLKDAALAKQYLQKAEAFSEPIYSYYKKLLNTAYGHYSLQTTNANLEDSKFWFKKNTIIVPPVVFDFSGAHFMLGKIYYLQDSSKLAIHHFKAAEASAQNINNPTSFNYQIIKWLAYTYAKNGDSLIASRYFIKSSEMGQKLNETNNITALNTFKFIRDEDMNAFEKQKIKIQHENEKQTFKLIIIVVVFVLLLFLIAFLIYRNLNKTLVQQKSELETALLKNNLLTKEMHHRVKNNLNTVSSLLSLQARKITNEDAIKALKDGQNRIKSVSILHQGLYQGEQDVAGKINLNEYVTRLAEHIAHLFKDEEKAVLFNISIPNDIVLSLTTATPLGLIVNEFITNSFKHAFIGVENGTISIEIKYNPTGENYTLIYQDNGIGMTDKNKTNSFGVALIDLLILQMGASLNVSSGEGIKYIIVFKNN